MTIKPHPLQPLYTDEHGTIRFKPNKIVQHLLEHGGIDMNQLASLEFSKEDRVQFAQLIGYSHSGAGSLSYFSDETYEAAAIAHEQSVSELEARATYLRDKLREVRDSMRNGIACLYDKHPDDLLTNDD